MCDIFIGVRPSGNYPTSCRFVSKKRDMDGDYEKCCIAPSSYNCGYKCTKKDCDGDTVTVCGK